MLEGLEITIVNKSKAFDPFFKARIDPEFFQKHYILMYSKILALDNDLISNIALVTDGEHGNAVTQTKGYSKYFGARNVLDGILNDNGVEYITKEHHEKLKKTALKPRDVLISCVGANIGFASIVPDNIGIGNIVRNVALIRSNTQINNEYLLAYFRTEYGKSLYYRMNTGNAQPLVSLDYINTIPIYKPSQDFQLAIKNLITISLENNELSKRTFYSAEIYLLETLGLNNFEPSTDGVNVKSFKESFLETGRLDAEYYQKKFDILEKAIRSQNHKTIKEIRTDNYRGMQPIYVENGDLDIINSKHILEDSLDYNGFEKTSSNYWDIQSRARVYKGDILTYTTGANIGRTQVYQSDKRALASNHVNIIRIKEQNPVYIGFVLNSLVGRMQTDKFSAGSAQAELYPKDLDEFLIPIIDYTQQEKIAALIEESFSLKKQSEQLLETAKRAVEIAIEQDEDAAMRYIEEATN